VPRTSSRSLLVPSQRAEHAVRIRRVMRELRSAYRPSAETLIGSPSRFSLLPDNLLIFLALLECACSVMARGVSYGRAVGRRVLMQARGGDGYGDGALADFWTRVCIRATHVVAVPAFS
jgi:hypothetical protein